MAARDEDGIERRGLMLVLSAPSGAGATTLSRLLLDRVPGLQMSVSVTTRAMRSGEVDGRDYLFVDRARFEDLVKRHELLECATVFDTATARREGPSKPRYRPVRTCCSTSTGRAPSSYVKKPGPTSCRYSSSRLRPRTWNGACIPVVRIPTR
jgi:hypothetical protein